MSKCLEDQDLASHHGRRALQMQKGGRLESVLRSWTTAEESG